MKKVAVVIYGGIQEEEAVKQTWAVWTRRFGTGQPFPQLGWNSRASQDEVNMSLTSR